jgi:hypothetical protein
MSYTKREAPEGYTPTQGGGYRKGGIKVPSAKFDAMPATCSGLEDAAFDPPSGHPFRRWVELGSAVFSDFYVED